MPIITQEGVRTLLQLPDNSSDELVKTLIPIAQQKICAYCRNNFLDVSKQSTSSNLTFDETTVVDSNNTTLFSDEDFDVGDYFIRGSKHNDGFRTIKTVESDTLTISDDAKFAAEAADRTVTITKVKFPTGIELDVALFIKWMMSMKGKTVKSESLPGGYSVTYKNEREQLKSFNLYRKPYQ